MTVSSLKIQNLRNIASTTLTCHPKINIFLGPNGSGKTALLEALHLLSHGYSFRSREVAPLIRQGEESLTVFARLASDETLSIQKSLHLPTKIQLNHLPCQRRSELAQRLPAQIFYQHIFQIIEAGPLLRRRLLDWGVFHAYQEDLSLWKKYEQALKQRNLLLKQKAAPLQLQPWNQLIDKLSQTLDAYRSKYFTSLEAKFQTLWSASSELTCLLRYYRGWDLENTGKSLEELLYASYFLDLKRHSTQYGAHQADLLIEALPGKAKHYFSRGQQKKILFFLKMAQIQLLAKPCIFLLDDLGAELDEESLIQILRQLRDFDGQCFISALNEKALFLGKEIEAFNAFYVDKGKVEAL